MNLQFTLRARSHDAVTRGSTSTNPKSSATRFPTLDVVVEGAVSIPVLVEDAEGVAVSEVLKLYQAVHPVPAGQQSGSVTSPRGHSLALCLLCASTHLSVTACMNSSISSSYSFPLILLCLSPMYRGSSSNPWTESHSVRSINMSVNQIQLDTTSQ